MAYNISVLGLEEQSEYDDLKIRYICGDLLRPATYIPYIKGIDTVVHMAAVTHTNDINKYYRVNCEGTSQLLKVCRSHSVNRFIFISTRAISPDGGGYSRSKLTAERYVQESGMDWIILRIAEVYGISGDRGINAVLNQIQKFPIIPIIGSGEYNICPVHISDVINSIVEVIERPHIKNRVYNIAGPETFTYNEFIDRIMAVRRLKRIKIHMPISLLGAALRLSAPITKDRFIVLDQLTRLTSEKSDDISLAVEDLSFNPARIEDMMSKT
jgi:NADH dehydrogenase